MPMIEVTDSEFQILRGFRNLIEENNDAQLKALEETYFAKSKQTLFTMAELAKKWKCSKQTVDKILKESNIDPIGKSGKEHLYDIDQALDAKQSYDGETLHQHKLNWKMRAM